MHGFGITDIGCVRERNEDAFLLHPPYLGIVADGMGGHLGGQEASTLAIEVISQMITPENQPQEGQIQSWLASALEEANRQIYGKSGRDSKLNGMGTTLSLTYFYQSMMYWSHVGDSRIYLFRENSLKQITKDHTLASTREGKRSHVLTRALGVQENIHIDTGMTQIFVKDQVLLCSDGLYDVLAEKEIEKVLKSARTSVEESVQRLVNSSLEKQASDNITAVLIRFDKER